MFHDVVLHSVWDEVSNRLAGADATPDHRRREADPRHREELCSLASIDPTQCTLDGRLRRAAALCHRQRRERQNALGLMPIWQAGRYVSTDDQEQLVVWDL